MFRPISIKAVLNGWIVTVGCQTVVYQDRNQLISDLDAYLKDPDATEARVLRTAVNQTHTLGGGGDPAAPPANMGEAAAPREVGSQPITRADRDR
jgi:hypothetical protein